MCAVTYKRKLINKRQDEREHLCLGFAYANLFILYLLQILESCLSVLYGFRHLLRYHNKILHDDPRDQQGVF